MKHAYCIEAHTDFDILEKIFRLLDDEMNDFFVHVDKKSKIDKKHFENILEKSTVKWVKRYAISWGGGIRKSALSWNCLRMHMKMSTIIII